MPFELDRKLWYTADKNSVVEDGDPKAAFLLGNVGYRISDEEAERLGLKKESAKENKRFTPAENKGSDNLPNDFPAYSILIDAGYSTYTAVRNVDDLTAIDGIGSVTAKKIENALR